MDLISVKRFLVQIWPTVYKIINGLFYFIISLIKTFFSVAYSQIRNR